MDINDPAGEMLRLFAGCPLHHLPVLDQEKVVGMLSSADVMKLDLFLPKGSKSPIDYLNQRMKVGPLVRRPVLTIQPYQSVEGDTAGKGFFSTLRAARAEQHSGNVSGYWHAEQMSRRFVTR